MRLALIVICLTGATGLASISARADDSSGKSEHSTGRTQTPETDQDILGRSGSVPEARQICRRYAPSRGRILGLQAYS